MFVHHMAHPTGMESLIMPNHNVLAVANQFCQLQSRNPSQMKLQKLCYIAHGWNLAINNSPLVSDNIEAWDGGPVFRSIWNYLRDKSFGTKERFFINPLNSQPWDASFEQSERDIIKQVWVKYGDFTGMQLSELTHKPGTPWSNAYFGMGRNSQIQDNDIKQHFRELAIAGRA